MHASLARKRGLEVSGFMRETRDGRPVVIFLCGQLAATSSIDGRFGEVIVAGRRFLQLPFEAISYALENAGLHTADELVAKIRQLVAEHEDRLDNSKHSARLDAESE